MRRPARFISIMLNGNIIRWGSWSQRNHTLPSDSRSFSPNKGQRETTRRELTGSFALAEVSSSAGWWPVSRALSGASRWGSRLTGAA